VNILIIEDEVKLVGFLKKGLKEQGYKVDVAYDGHSGERLALQGKFDIIILDLIIPQLNGLELCKKIRLSNQTVPILMLTALGSTENKVTGFDAGADDYLAKPFEFQELLARIRALIKRSAGMQHNSGILKVFDLELDLFRKTVKRGDKTISLTAKEFALLDFFMMNKGRILSRIEISQKVWDIGFDTGTNVVDVYVNILRKKIDRGNENKLIHTRIGLGYVFDQMNGNT